MADLEAPDAPAIAATRTPPASRALERFFVLDLTRVRAGPTCVRQLADWGADVVKVELPPSADAAQLGGPRSGFDFQNLHRNKRSLSLNLKTNEGLRIFRELARKADVIVENYRPDVKHRLGIDYETLSADNPGLIYASISGFGQDGPYAGRPGFDQIAQGLGGLMSITGEPGRGPMRVGIPIADLTAGMFAVQGILVALLEREVSGRGQWIQTSLLQSQIFMLDFQASRYLMDGEIPKQAGNNHPTSIPTGVFKTADGYMNVAVAGQVIWKRFCEVLGRTDLVENPDYATPPDRSTNRDALGKVIGEELAKASTAEWVEKFNEQGVPAGPIYNIGEVFADPQVQHLDIAQPVESHERGASRLVGQPITMSRTSSSITAPPPRAGEHTDDVLRALGYSDSDINDLRTRGIV